MASEPREYSFGQPRNLGVLVCDHVWEHGEPILYVSHDDAGDWQFLCGGLHDDGSSKPVLVSLESVVARDGSLNGIATIGINHWAERESSAAPWTIVDQTEEDIRHAVDGPGFFVALFAGAGESESIAYTIGLNKSIGHPELLMMGKPLEVMEKALTELAERLKASVRYHPGEKIFGLPGSPYFLRPVDSGWLGEYLGYALWYYGHHCEAVQVVWADDDGGIQPDLRDAPGNGPEN